MPLLWPFVVTKCCSKLVVVGQQRHIPRGRQGLRQRVRRFSRSGRAWVKQADGGGVAKHEHHAAVWQQDSTGELLFPDPTLAPLVNVMVLGSNRPTKAEFSNAKPGTLQ